MKIITSEDIKRIIKEKSKCIACTLEKVLIQDNSISKSNHSSREEVEMAIQYLANIDTLDIEKLLTLTTLLFQIGEYDSSYSYASKILELDDKNKDAYLIRAKYFYQWGSYSDALEEVSQAIELSQEAKDTVDKITDHFKDPINTETKLEVNPGQELKSMLELRDLILSKSHNTMNIYG